MRKKLGVTAQQMTWRQAMPDAVADEIDGNAPPQLLGAPVVGLDSAHIFATEVAVLQAELARLRGLLAPNGIVWVSWPEKASKVPTDINEDVIRSLALPLGFVDVKVCAVDAVWSGLKLVTRVSARG